jgi:glutaconate CoA-transferase subunit A
MVEHSEGTALDRFRAACMGLTFFPVKTPLGTSLTLNPENQTTVTCPFTGEVYAALKPWEPDVAIIHAHYSDQLGNIQYDRDFNEETYTEPDIARAGKLTIVTVEHIVGEEFIYQNPNATMIPGFHVDVVVEAPFGAHPGSCDLHYEIDYDHLAIYQEKAKADCFQEYLDEFVFSCNDHSEYLEKVGVDNLIKIRDTRRF